MPYLIAHRGWHQQEPENTIAAFAAALECGFAGCETDVRLDRDGVAILFHDRLAHNGVAVSQLTQRELSQIQQYEVPSLFDTLIQFPDAYWNIELKSPDCLAATLAVLQALPRLEHCLISSFHHPLALAAAHQTNYDCAFLLAHTPVSLSFIERAHLNEARLNHVVLDFEICNDEIIERCSELGIKVWVYGAANAEEYLQLKQWPLQGIISDHPHYLGLDK
ncbi:glycerophosphodiester phosphodiesterase [Chitinibacter sp. S2-10]|uniref:glycerophosphodiester phosphodiesterase n=1 Tax=Chitinibacter sp. S2-10 TaxID=3373597 RepID=UPI0039773D13